MAMQGITIDVYIVKGNRSGFIKTTNCHLLSSIDGLMIEFLEHENNAKFLFKIGPRQMHHVLLI